jgi:hypothetical protein
MSNHIALASVRRLSAHGWQTLACAAARICYGWTVLISSLRAAFFPQTRLSSWRRFGASLWDRIPYQHEVLPHRYGTHTDDPSQGTVESVLGEADRDRGAHATTVESGGIRQARVDRDEFRCGPCARFLRRTAARVLGILSTPTAHRTGDYAGQSLGEQKEEKTHRRWSGASLLTIVTESGKKTRCGSRSQSTLSCHPPLAYYSSFLQRTPCFLGTNHWGLFSTGRVGY